MPFYHRLGGIPRKRHSIFRQADGSLYPEELVGNKGFVGPSSLLYHLHQPTGVRQVETVKRLPWEPDETATLRHRHFRTQLVRKTGCPILERIPLLYNSDVAASFSKAPKGDSLYYRNAQGDELVYVSSGSGILKTQFGDLPFRSGDYLVIHRGILHQYSFDTPAELLILECAGYVRSPRQFRNEFGQLIEGSPYSERDIRVPQELKTYDETGEFPIIIKQYNALTRLTLARHPFDVVGWDGYYYPWAINIEDYEPKVGRFHLPPPAHQTFECEGFVVCSFCPRPYDFDPEAIPAPYNHSNVMSDEVLYYASDEFMSRKGIQYGSITLHPDGIPHGPHPGRTEASIGAGRTDELAVMFDTFRPLQVARQALAIEDKSYQLSWLSDDA